MGARVSQGAGRGKPSGTPRQAVRNAGASSRGRRDKKAGKRAGVGEGI